MSNEQTNSNTEPKTLTMNDILSASFGQIPSQVRASFKKTTLIRPYETEVTEIDTMLTFEEGLTGPERLLTTAIVLTQIEYTAYCMLVKKGMVQNNEFIERRSFLESAVDSIKTKAEQLQGESLDHILNIK